MSRPDLPHIRLSRLLAEWLAGPRGRLLRRAAIGRRTAVLEVGCGHGVVTEELIRRAAGSVTAIDPRPPPAPAEAHLAAADATALPFARGSFDLILCQNVLLWIRDPGAALAEMVRTLQGGGALVAIEPDFGGMIEHPPEIALQDLWLEGLRRAGADPTIGRALPGMCEALGLDVWVELQGIPRPATPEAVDLLADLPLPQDARPRLCRAKAAIAARTGTWDVFLHVPYVLIAATKP